MRMNFSPAKKTSNIFLLVAAFGIVSLILWNTNSFFQKFKEEERFKMEIWATAQSELLQSSEERDLGNLHVKIFQSNTSTPMILVNRDGSIRTNNMEEELVSDSLYLQEKITQFRGENQPIHISYKGEELATLYYGNSEVLNKLKYYPVALLLIIFLFATVIFFFFRTNKASEQNKLWAGMAKETAHQIGTPLTSLLGWNELLRSEGIKSEVTREIEKDINRLQTITERFSKIGSAPTLQESDLVSETREALEYLERRSSKMVHFSFHATEQKIPVFLNRALYHWTIENLVKNGIDAMKGKGEIGIEIHTEGRWAQVLISDSGHGIQRKNYRRIFNPGVTSKRRGWGLGLSLVRRIVEEYHQGKVKVLSSGNMGTVMQVTLKVKTP